jgi:glycosyltransferase involved in cell wall biosynthesis
VVATQVGGVVDLMGCVQAREGAIKICERGVMVPAGDAKSLERAVACLVADAALRRRTAEAGRAYVRACYSAQRLAAEMESLYGELLDGATKAACQGAPARTSREAGDVMTAGSCE